MRRSLVFALSLALPLVFACDVDQTREAEAPDVDVEVEGGQAPEFDVETADVEVGTEEDTLIVEQPTVDVDMPED